MEKNHDIRWEQRFSNFRKALLKLSEAVKGDPENFSELEQEGLIKRFEYTHELAWNVMKDFIAYQGNNNITGSRDAIREAFQLGLIENGESWMQMIGSRNKSSHTYDNTTATEIAKSILSDYYQLFKSFELKMESLRSGGQKEIFTREI